MYIRVEEPLDRKLKDVWTFWVRDSSGRLEVVLDCYVRLMRPSPRHRNWEVVQRWNRVDQRNDTLKERPEVHQHTIDQALKQLTEATTVVLDWK